MWFRSVLRLFPSLHILPRSLLPEGRVTVCLATRSIRLPSLRSETGPLRGVRRGEVSRMREAGDSKVNRGTDKEWKVGSEKQARILMVNFLLAMVRLTGYLLPSL